MNNALVLFAALSCAAPLYLALGPSPIGPAPMGAGAASGADARLPRPELVGPGVVSTNAGEYSPTFDAERGELYFMRRTPGLFDYTIWRARTDGERWTDAEVVSFSGDERDAGPYLAPDGASLVFDSARPTESLEKDSINLWRVERAEDGQWGEPALMAGASNAGFQPGRAEFDEFGPAIDGEGRIWFYSFRSPYRGGSRYVVDTPDAKEARRDTSVPDPSARTFVSYLWLSADGRTAVMEGRAKGRRDSDLFVSNRVGSRWTEPRPVPGVNTSSGEGGPWVTPDGAWLWFTSDRASGDDRAGTANLYRVAVEGRLDPPSGAAH